MIKVFAGRSFYPEKTTVKTALCIFYVAVELIYCRLLVPITNLEANE